MIRCASMSTARAARRLAALTLASRPSRRNGVHCTRCLSTQRETSKPVLPQNAVCLLGQHAIHATVQAKSRTVFGVAGKGSSFSTAQQLSQQLQVPLVPWGEVPHARLPPGSRAYDLVALASPLSPAVLSRHTEWQLADKPAEQGYSALLQAWNPRKARHSWRAGTPSARSDTPIRILVLDGVTDVGNVAAIMRAALLYQIHGVILHNSVHQFDGVAAAISAGASEHLLATGAIAVVHELGEHLRRLQELGAAVCVTAVNAGSVGAGTEQLDGFRALAEHPIQLVVLGSEGAGVSPAALQAATHTVHISCADATVRVAPSAGSVPSVPRGSSSAASPSSLSVDSLNVSAAAAVILHSLCQR